MLTILTSWYTHTETYVIKITEAGKSYIIEYQQYVLYNDR